MKAKAWFHNRIVAALVSLLLAVPPAFADSARLDELFQRLQNTDDVGAQQIEAEIWSEWSKSGSPAMDLLLERGRSAMQAGDFVGAIGQFTAVIDHAPDFAEAYNERATAYYQSGKLGPSIADLRMTLRLNPRHFGALTGLAIIFEDIDQPEKALEVYKAALVLQPHLPEVKSAVARIETALQGKDL
ncbi:MAG: tetratricopeptide repeat protein [Cypionkella sp.]|jgi:tetratricopeptide (TPR) repeat protein|nr:tetratricopeptide repeat protein [Cypionkella sp.]